MLCFKGIKPKTGLGEQVGGFAVMRTEDLKRVAPLWLNYSEAVREDPEAWRFSGDIFAKKAGDKPWIAEMYGYSFGAAAANVWHQAPPCLFKLLSAHALAENVAWHLPRCFTCRLRRQQPLQQVAHDKV